MHPLGWPTGVLTCSGPAAGWLPAIHSVCHAQPTDPMHERCSCRHAPPAVLRTAVYHAVVCTHDNQEALDAAFCQATAVAALCKSGGWPGEIQLCTAVHTYLAAWMDPTPKASWRQVIACLLHTLTFLSRCLQACQALRWTRRCSSLSTCCPWLRRSSCAGACGCVNGGGCGVQLGSLPCTSCTAKACHAVLADVVGKWTCHWKFALPCLRRPFLMPWQSCHPAATPQPCARRQVVSQEHSAASK